MCPHAQRHLATWIILHFWSYMNEWCLPVHNRGLVTTTINIFNSLNVRNLFRITGSLGLGSLSTGWTVRGSNPGGGEIFRACPGAHPASCTMGTGSFPGVKSGRGVTLTPHPLPVPWSRKRRAIPLLPLWVVRPVQSLSACTRVHFTFFLPTGSLTLLPSSDVPSNTHVQDQTCSVLQLVGGEAHTVLRWARQVGQVFVARS